VVGVADPDCRGIQVGTPVDLYAPLCSVAILRDDPKVLEHRSMWYLRVIGRMAPGVSLARAQSELGAISSGVFTAPGNLSDNLSEGAAPP
jgi:hypothetical protein